MADKFRVVTLFFDIGGFEKGLEKWERYPRSWFVVCRISMLIIFSRRKRKGFNDIWETLFFDIVRILEEKKPKYILLENVKNLISHDNSNTI